MPIYTYHCVQCGHEEDHFLKIKDSSPKCSQCGSSEYQKKLSAPRFQLKGSGWYETDFKTKPAAPSNTSTTDHAQNQTDSSSNKGVTSPKD